MTILRHTVAAALFAALGLAAAPAQAATQGASVALSNTLQVLTVINSPASTAQLVEVVLDFGPAAAGIATFENAPGATSSNFWVSEPGLALFQTATWTGLAVAPGAELSFFGLDPETITSLVPPDFNTAPDVVGTTLAQGSITVRWSDGAEDTVELIEQSWQLAQTLLLSGESVGIAVPSPAAAPLFALGLLGLGLAGRRRA